MAIPASETLENRISVHNPCSHTTRRNAKGFVCNMHPSEGLFRGAPRGS